jgi:hypothetical protein
VHLTLGILRKSQAVFYALTFFWLDGFAVPTPAQVTQTVGRLAHQNIMKNFRKDELSKNIPNLISILLGIIAVSLSWRAYQVSAETKEVVLQQMRPNILLVDASLHGGIRHYLGYQDSRNYECVQIIRLQNAGGMPTSLTDYDVTVTYQDKSANFSNEQHSAVANSNADTLSGISSFRTVFFSGEIQDIPINGDLSKALSFPIQIKPYSAIDFLLAFRYILDLDIIEFNETHWHENDLAISYNLHFASGQTLEIPSTACQSIKYK